MNTISFRDIDFILENVCCEKVTLRNKAFDLLFSHFDSKKNELADLFSDENHVELSFVNIYQKLHDSVKNQALRLENSKCSEAVKKRCSDHTKAISQLLELANDNYHAIDYNVILQKTFDCFSDAICRKHFGESYLLLASEYLRKSANKLSNVKLSDWSKLLSYWMELYEEGQMKKNILIEFLLLIIQNGIRYKMLADDFHQYNSQILRIVNEQHDVREFDNMLLFVQEYIIKLAPTYRISLCDFAEKIVKTLVKSYKYSLYPESKINLFQIFHLSMVIHYPNGLKNDTSIENDSELWRHSLNGMHSCIDMEIRKYISSMASLRFDYILSDDFAEISAMLMMLLFHNKHNNKDSVNEIENGEQPSKRAKTQTFMQKIIESIRQDEECVYLKIVSKILCQDPTILTFNDFKDLLLLLTQKQQEIQTNKKMEAFTDVIESLLSIKILLNCNDSENLTAYWHKMAQLALKNSSVNCVTAIQSLRLLKLLIKQNRIDSTTIIVNIIKDTTSNLVEKSNITLELLINLLKSPSMDATESSDEQKINIINWLHATVLQNHDKFHENLVGELYFLCCVTHLDETNKISLTLMEQINEKPTKHLAIVNKLRNIYSRQSLTKLMALEEQHQEVYESIFRLPGSSEIEITINAKVYEALEKCIVFNVITDMASPSETINTMMFELKSLINILNQFLLYKSFDKIKFEKSQFVKGINFVMQKFNNDIRQNEPKNNNEALQTLGNMNKIWNIPLHPEILKLIFRDHNTGHILQWIQNCLSTRERSDSGIEYLIDNLPSVGDQIQLSALILISRFGCFGEEYISQKALSALQYYEWNINSNEHVFILDKIIKSILNENLQNEQAMNFVFSKVKELCVEYFNQQFYAEMIFQYIPGLMRSLRDVDDEHNHLLQILHRFLKKAYKNQYDTHLTVQTTDIIKYFVKYYSSYDCLKAVTYPLANFIQIDDIEVQLAAIDCISYIFDHRKYDEIDSSVLCEFHKDFYNSLKISEVIHSEDDHQDRVKNVNTVRLQIYCAIIGKCVCLRKIGWWEFVHFTCYVAKVDEGLQLAMMKELSSKMFKLNYSDAIKDFLPFLITKTIELNLNILAFPWYLTESSSQEEFINQNINSIVLTMVRYQRNMLRDLKVQSIRDLISDSAINGFLAYALPAHLKSDTMSNEYKSNAAKVQQALVKWYPNDYKTFYRSHSYSLKIIQELLNYTWDIIVFKKYFGSEMKIEFFLIDIDIFRECVKFIQNQNNFSKNLFQHFFIQEPHQLAQFLNELKLRVQNKIFDENKIIELFRLCVILDEISECMIDQSAPDANYQFFFGDILHFFGNSIASEKISNQIRLAMCRYLLLFCQNILSICSRYFTKHLYFIVSTLVSTIKNNDNNEIQSAAMQLLSFLVVDHKNDLREAISLLDHFPVYQIFDRLREIHCNIKYFGLNAFSLVEEIEYFLKVENRSVEGLEVLKEQISTKKSELCKIFENISLNRRFSEDYDDSIIHQLIRSLLKIIQSSDDKKAVIASKCLGEIGPSDLRTIVLKSDIQSNVYKYCNNIDTAEQMIADAAVDVLNKLLYHEDINILKLVIEALKHLFSTSEADLLLDSYPHMRLFKTNQFTKVLNAISTPMNLGNNFEVEQITHSEWIRNFSKSLLNAFQDIHLSAIANHQVDFAEAMIVPLIKSILASKKSSAFRELSQVVNAFFEKSFNRIKNENNLMEDSSLYHNKKSVKTMLEVAECIRIHNINIKKFSELAQPIELNNFHIAFVALYCEAYFSSIIFAEIAYLNGKKEDNANLKTILKVSYKAIGQKDAVLAFLNPKDDEIEYFREKRMWEQLYSKIDVLAMTNPTDAYSMYSEYLYEDGLFELSREANKKTEKINYECLWRLSDWNYLNASNGVDENYDENFSKYHYFSMKSFCEKNEMNAKLNLELARNNIIRKFRLSKYECVKNIYKNLMNLNQLQQIEDFCTAQFNGSEIVAKNLIQKWKAQDDIQTNDFIFYEPVLAQRVKLFDESRIVTKRRFKEILRNGSAGMLFNLAKCCREENHFNLAFRYLNMLKSYEMEHELELNMNFEKAKLCWSKGDQQLSEQLISLVRKTSKLCMPVIEAQRFYGNYLAETRSNDGLEIVKCFQFSIKSSNDLQNNMNNARNLYDDVEVDKFVKKNKLKSFESLAKYADHEYQTATNLINSHEFKRKEERIEINKRKMAELGKNIKLCKDENVYMYNLKKSVGIDDKECSDTKENRDNHLAMAIENYIKCMLMDEMSNHMYLFRLFALITENQNNERIINILDENLDDIRSYKILQIMSQLTTYMSNADDKFSRLIMKIVDKCVQDHPHHTLYHIFSLVNANHDISEKFYSHHSRIQAAKNLIEKLRSKTKLREVIKQMERMCIVLIDFANKSYPNKTQEISSSEPILKLKNLNHIHCMTIKMPISSNASYNISELTTIVRWESKFSSPGGINVPKKMTCLCSDGKKYAQLLKSRDDLRQDAVMQQVFTMMNDMLSKSNTTKKENLSIRTYIVIPLSKRSGILEWCENTIPLTTYLADKNNAHERFNPKDENPMTCRKLLIDATKKQLTPDKRYNLFLEICKMLNPALQYFFFENFFSPGVFYERRLAYAHSLATNSMIGYILGIGDRHVGNILLDKLSGELIFIDFGIAFEQGKMMPTPEMIPFRLTRDMVAALGATGVEGVFRKSCEKTMQVLRDNKTTIVTILNVLLHDPLYSWTVSSTDAMNRQRDELDAVPDLSGLNDFEEQQVNTMAERAIMRLKEKLDGNHYSRSEGSSVEAHVEILIQEAINKRNLSRMFHGWQAYL